jgi:hypothetical protein
MGKVKIGSRVLVGKGGGKIRWKCVLTMISCLAPLGTIFKLNNVQRMSTSTSNRHLYRSLLRELRLSVGDCPPPPVDRSISLGAALWCIPGKLF